MRHRALPYLLPALQALSPLLNSLYAELGFRRQRLRAEKEFRRRVVPTVGYTQAMIAPRLQTQLRPWLRELIDTPGLVDKVTERLLHEASAAIRESMYWAFSFEAGGRLVSAGKNGSGSGGTQDIRALFVPLIWERGYWTPMLPGVLRQSLRELLYAHGLVHADEAVLVAPMSFPPQTVTQLVPLAGLLDFALGGAVAAWGPAVAPAADLSSAWEDWWGQPDAPAGAPVLRPLEVRLALLVIVSPDPTDETWVALQPWQQEARTELLLIDRFDSGAILEVESEADLGAESQQAFLGWIDALNDLLSSTDTPVIVAAPPSDAYTACGRGAVEAGCQFVRAYQESEDEDAPVYLIGDSAGLAVELGGASHRMTWAPDGVLMPGMLPVIEEVIQATMGRRVERSIGQELDRLSLIGQL
ncbi:MAG TPA: hypothetical protein VFY81_10805 [Gammaproteobacteria bacterium]|nr:hypothetical protein [Gammaproteobacteria bacterium]